MGCTIMFTPTLRALRQKFPEAKITLLGTARSYIAPVEGSNLMDEILVFDFAKNSLLNLKKLGQRLKFIRQLRREHFDYSITVFPSNKWFFNVFAWLVHAKKMITHRYSTPAIKTLAGLQNVRIPADPKLHDVDQNLNLLKPLGIDPAKVNRRLLFHATDENDRWAENFRAQNFERGKVIVGMHIGSSQDYSFAAKRWPLERFAALADRIQKELYAHVLIVAGPDEKEDVIKMKSMMKTRPVVATAALKNAAALIKKCRVFVSNDSGLMHIAVAMQTPVVAIFGPTSITRTRPYTDKAEVIFDPERHSLLKYPFTTTSAKLDARAGQQCFERITVDQVFAAVKKQLI